MAIDTISTKGAKRTYYTKEEWLALPLRTRHKIEKEMLFVHLKHSGRRAAKFLLQKLKENKIDGSQYFDRGKPDEEECGCVVGLLMTGAGKLKDTAGYTEMDSICRTEVRSAPIQIAPGSYAFEVIEGSPVETLVLNLYPGETSRENTTVRRMLIRWVEEWLELTDRSKKAKEAKANG